MCESSVLLCHSSAGARLSTGHVLLVHVRVASRLLAQTAPVYKGAVTGSPIHPQFSYAEWHLLAEDNMHRNIEGTNYSNMLTKIHHSLQLSVAPCNLSYFILFLVTVIYYLYRIIEVCDNYR